MSDQQPTLPDAATAVQRPQAAALPEAADASAADERPPVWRRKWAEVADMLARPPAKQAIKTRQQGETTLNYLEWTTVKRALDVYAPGWDYRITRIDSNGNTVSVAVEIIFRCSDGTVIRAGTGGAEIGSGYGEAVERAERTAFKRAAAMAGYGFVLYLD